MTRRAAPLLLILAAVACTGGGVTAPPSSSPAPTTSLPGSIPASVEVHGRPFDVSCEPVAQALVDIPLPHAGGDPMVRAITGLWDRQAVAVLANDPSGCGVWALGLAQGLSDEAVVEIRAEVDRGVRDFGVTESPVPHEG